MPVADSLRRFLHAYAKVLSLIVTMLIGALIPQASALSFLMQYLLMAMLFFAFLKIEVSPKTFQKRVLWVLLANLAVAFLAYRVVLPVNGELAVAAFITAIAPTAISSTVIISFIEGKVDFMVASVLLTNVAMALIIPFALPLVLGADATISTWVVLKPVLVTMFVPLILARLVDYLPAGVQAPICAGKRYSFPIWLLNLFIVSAKASDFLRNESTGAWVIVLQIALIALVICILNFSLGALLGGRQYWQETSQALGQKNNSFAIWIALAFINPLAAMGPTFYVLYHNLYNTWQIYRFERRSQDI